MRRSFLIASVLALLSFFASPTSACMAVAPLQLEDVKHADLVVVGTIENFRSVLDPVAREERRSLLEKLPEDTDPEFREFLESQSSFYSDYARFEILVDEVLIGTASNRIEAVWNTFGMPESLEPRSYLVALIKPGPNPLPLRGPSATILSHPDGTSLSVLQAPCADAFIFPSVSEAADGIRTLLSENESK